MANDFSGTWRSIYGYHSNSRDNDYADEHTVHITQSGNLVTVKSAEGSASEVTMQLTVEQDSLFGTWYEHTQKDGHYKGKTFSGAVLFIVRDGVRLEGKWLGAGSSGAIQTGPWELIRT